MTRVGPRILLLCLGLGVPLAGQAGLDAALEEIDAGCRERAAEVVAEQWPTIREQAEARGLEVTPRHRAAHERVMRRRCALSERIELVEALREDFDEAEWESFGGEELLLELRQELQQLQR